MAGAKRTAKSQHPPGPVTPAEKALADHMEGLPKEVGPRLFFWRPDEAPQLLDREPDAYRDKVFGFVLDHDPEADWWVSTTIIRRGEGLAFGRVTIEPNTFKYPHEPPPGLDSTVLRRVRVSEFMARALAAAGDLSGLRLVADAFPGAVSEADMALAERTAEEAGGRQRKIGRPTTRDDAFYEGVAREYLALQMVGWGRGIVREIARHRQCARETARDWVKEARRRGFLTSGTPGVAGARPGPRLVVEEETATAVAPTKTRRTKR